MIKESKRTKKWCSFALVTCSYTISACFTLARAMNELGTCMMASLNGLVTALAFLECSSSARVIGYCTLEVRVPYS